MRQRLLALLTLLLVGSLGVGMRGVLAARSPLTIEEAIASTLSRADAHSAGIRVENGQCVPARETCLSYIADVVLPGEHATGRLACVVPWQHCTLTMAEFGLRAAPVPDVGVAHPMIRWVRTLMEQAINKIHGFIGS